MASIQPFLSKQQQLDLIEWLAVNSDKRYDLYTEWCARTGAKPFSPNYLRTWTQNHRELIQKAREQHRREARAESVMARTQRLHALEDSFIRLDELSKSEGLTSVDVVRLEDQKRKTLEAIARERGEWGIKDDAEDEERKRANQELAKAFRGLREA